MCVVTTGLIALERGQKHIFLLYLFIYIFSDFSQTSKWNSYKHLEEKINICQNSYMWPVTRDTALFLGGWEENNWWQCVGGDIWPNTTHISNSACGRYLVQSKSWFLISESYFVYIKRWALCGVDILVSELHMLNMWCVFQSWAWVTSAVLAGESFVAEALLLRSVERHPGCESCWHLHIAPSQVPTYLCASDTHSLSFLTKM